MLQKPLQPTTKPNTTRRPFTRKVYWVIERHTTFSCAIMYSPHSSIVIQYRHRVCPLSRNIGCKTCRCPHTFSWVDSLRCYGWFEIHLFSNINNHTECISLCIDLISQHYALFGLSSKHWVDWPVIGCEKKFCRLSVNVPSKYPTINFPSLNLDMAVSNRTHDESHSQKVDWRTLTMTSGVMSWTLSSSDPFVSREFPYQSDILVLFGINRFSQWLGRCHPR